MAFAIRKLQFACLSVAGCLYAGGCVYSGGQSHTLDESGTPLGITALSIPFNKLVLPAPAPAGYSSTYQKMVLEQQRLARRQVEREAQAQAKSSEAKPADKTDAAQRPTPAA